MKKILAGVLAAVFTIFGSAGQVLAADSSGSDFDAVPGTISETYVVMDARTGQVLLEKGMNQRMFPASITKIMTVALALENKKLTDTITMSEEAVDIPWDSSHVALLAGEILTVEQLVHATMLPSANDAANGLAECVSGSLEDFAVLMNSAAKEAGALGTHFNNAHGLPDTQHYTTAYDMAMITKYALGVDGFRNVFGAIEFTCEPTNLRTETRNWGTEHYMIAESSHYYEDATGGKLGWTKASQYTAVTLAERDGIELICVVMKSAEKLDKYEDSIALFDYCFENFRYVTVRSAEDDVLVPVVNNEEAIGNASVSRKGTYRLLLHNSLEPSDVKISYKIPESIEQANDLAPVIELTVKSGLMYETLGQFPLDAELISNAALAMNDSESVLIKLPERETDAIAQYWTDYQAVLYVLGGAVAVFMILYLIRRRNLRRNERIRAQRRAQMLRRGSLQ